MAAYFEFDKRHPHIKYDDVYVKNGKVENNKLVLTTAQMALSHLKLTYLIQLSLLKLTTM